MLEHLTIVMAVYGQPEMLAHNLIELSCLSDELHKKLKVIVVDDCGDPPARVAHHEFLDIELYRITEDIPWNQMGARNLAMTHAQGWCLMIDPDMVFSPGTIRRLMNVASKLKRGQVVRYGLRHMGRAKKEEGYRPPKDGKIDVSSPNTYLIHRDDFWAAGGYDEDYAGNKGWSDVQMLDVLSSLYRVSRRADLFADFYGTEQISDAAVTSLDRNVAINRKKRLRKVAQVRKLGGWRRWINRHKGPNLRFPWEKVYPS